MRGYPYAKESEVGANLREDMEVIGFCSHNGIFSLTFTLLTQAQHPIMVYNHKKLCLRKSGAKRVNILRIELRDDVT